MRIRAKNIQKMLEHYREIALLGNIGSLLSWDMEVNLPEKGSESRAQQSALLTKILTDKWLDKNFKSNVEKASLSKLSDTEKAILKNVRHDGKLYFKVPPSILVEFSETASRGFMAWQKAKKNNDFGEFLPHLRKIVRLNQIIADHLGYKTNRYDALLNLFEPGLTTKKTKEVFGDIVLELTLILKAIQKSKNYEKQLLLSDNLSGQNNNYPISDQRQIALFVLRKINYDLSAGRMDVSSHPFTDTLSSTDVRITNRYKTNDFRESLMVALHEGGHALYEQGVDPDYENTPLQGGVSLGIHESQSRFWENQIGRSYEFAKFITPVLHAFYPDQLYEYGAEDFFAALNVVKPSLIRTEADEVTYNLHIALRFELEEALVNSRIDAKDLPDAWRSKMKKYLGIVPERDVEGVLQDVHWSHGLMGYFPTYTLGNLYSAQFAKAMLKEIDIYKLTESGDFGTVLSWLRTNIHRHGRLFWPDTLTKRITGGDLNASSYLAYIKEKYKNIYSF